MSSPSSSRDKKLPNIDGPTPVEGEYYDIHEPEQTQWQRLLHFLEVQHPGDMTTRQMFLYNEDLRPVEKKRRTWKWWNYVNFWIADALNINSLQIASTGVAAGMNWWQTWISVWLGYSIAGCFVVMMARTGAFYHVSFPVSCRASFGPFGSLWPVINRVVMAIIWFSVQTWIFGQCVQLILRSIFGNDLDQRLGGQLSGTTTFQFLSFFLAWLFQLPFLWVPPQHLRYLFNFKAVVAPIVGVIYLVWALTKSHGLGDELNQFGGLHGSELGWAFVSSTMNCVANFAALILNSPDFSRFAATKNASFYSQVCTIPISFAVTTLVGILASAATGKLYGQVYWSPLDILGRFLDGYSSGDRAGVFFIAVGFGIAQIGTNIAANSLSCGTDMTALLPRFMNIRRGSYFCAALALCLVPWHFFGSAATFTTYLSAYSVFLSSIAGVIICDYYWVRRGKLSLDDLFSGEKGSKYMYGRWGVNWRAFAAYLLGIVPNMPGFVGVTGVNVPIGAVRLYTLNYFVGFIVSFILYAFFVWIAPIAGVPEQTKGQFFKKGWFEEYVDVEGFEDRFLRKRTVESSLSSQASYRTFESA